MLGKPGIITFSTYFYTLDIFHTVMNLFFQFIFFFFDSMINFRYSLALCTMFI